MEWLYRIRDKFVPPPRDIPDIDDGLVLGYETTIMPRRPHVELFNDTHYRYNTRGDNTSMEKLWRIEKEEREAIFVKYSYQGNLIIVITQDTHDKLHLTYQYQHKQADITYKLYFYSAKSFLDNHRCQFERPEGIVLDSTHIIHVTILQKETLLLIFGFNSDGRLCLYCYSVVNNSTFSVTSDGEGIPPGDTGFSVECTQPYVLKDNQFTKLMTVVTSETQEEGQIAIMFSDLSDRPRPLLLYIWQCVPKLSLLKCINLTDIYKSMRGIVSGISFWNDRKDMILVTSCAQLFHLSLEEDGEHSKNYINLKKMHIFLEKDEERIKLIKLYPRYLKDVKEVLYGIGGNAKLFMIPDLSDWRTTPVKMIDLVTKLPLEELKVYDYEVCHFTKKLFLLTGNGYIYMYDLTTQRFNDAVKIPGDKHEVDEDWHMHLILNWFGTEAYFISHDHLYVVNAPIVNRTLKELARIAVLKAYSEDDILQLGFGSSSLSFLFNR